ncbi:MAG: PD-(D/E)XK nuclease family protein [Flavobacteriales bacterium]|nr:PD-(D/E)XK nuclease family protein [Flavobacteriales bacterium]MCB9166119.1 PD-(D/E)XK nuclease family protein [Flavobacteriales bacterium]
MNFLRRLAELLLNDHGTALTQVAVVLPSRRAGVHLRDHLATVSGGALWSPEIHTLDTFLATLTGIEALEHPVALLRMYRVHVELLADRADPLEVFLQWAPTALRDMNDVDQYLLDHETVYRDLRHLEEIDAWSYRSGDLSQGQQRLAQHWLHHGRMHAGLVNDLSATGQGTDGWIARTAAALVEASPGTCAWRMVWFAGLNALTPAQTKVVKKLQEVGSAMVAWDVDRYYLDDPIQEAGRFLRENIRALGEGRIPPTDSIASDPPTVSVVRTSGRMAQVWTAVSELTRSTTRERAGTSIILADERLLVPLLAVLPQELGPVNITMGLPLSGLPMTDLVEALIDLQTVATQGVRRSKALTTLLEHPFWRGVDPGLPAMLRARSTHPPGSLPATPPSTGRAEEAVIDALRNALVPTTTAVGLRKSLQHLVRAAQLAGPDIVQEEQLFRIALAIEELERTVNTVGSPITMNAYGEMLRGLLRGTRLDLFGEPLEGVQVMGVLESRATDHDRIILLGANEEQLPKGGPDHSFIPWDVRHAYGLPLREDATTVGAYPVLRMLHHARSITLVHGSGAEDGNGPSRFILQWKKELPERTGIRPTSQDIHIPAPARHDARIVLNKGPEELAILRACCEKGWSPTALATWSVCPLDFYFKYVVGVREQPGTSDGLGHDELGRIVHGVLENLLADRLGHWLIVQDVETMQQRLPALIAEQARILGTDTDIAHGAAFLQLSMARRALDNHLRHLHRRLELGDRIRSIAIEHELEAGLPAVHHGLDHTVRLRGRIDLIEERNGVVRIIDVKTGRADPSELKISTSGADGSEELSGKAFQMLLYVWAYLTRTPDARSVAARILPLRSRSLLDGIPLRVDGEEEIGREQLTAIGDLIGGPVRQIMDPTLPFAHRPGSRYCRFCAEGQ